MNKPYDDSNWRGDYAKNFCNNKRHLELLENGPKSLSQAWILGALHNEWKKLTWLMRIISILLILPDTNAGSVLSES